MFLLPLNAAAAAAAAADDVIDLLALPLFRLAPLLLLLLPLSQQPFGSSKSPSMGDDAKT